MPAPSYRQVKAFSDITKKLQDAAVADFLERIGQDMTADEMMDVAREVAYKYRMLGSELGAQWYDLCAELAGIEVDAADLDVIDEDALARRAANVAKSQAAQVNPTESFTAFLQAQIAEEIRTTGMLNLDRDYKRGVKGGRWARVPVGETCAWCLMLASNGTWYKSEKSAMFTDHGDKFHANCNCVAVYYANAEDISGYSGIYRYKRMYYEADNRRVANATGRDPYPEELKKRIDRARELHDEKYREARARDEDAVPWQNANEDAILMREMFGLE